jgi:hypothetical protein
MALARCILGKFLGSILPLLSPRPYIYDVKFLALLGAPYIYTTLVG